MSAEAQPLVEPDAEQMLAHVQHLFGGWLDGCHDGKVELAWTDPRDGKLSHAGIFGIDELDELVEQARQQNRIPGCNIYVGAALRKPDIPPFGRCTDADFFALAGVLRRHRRRRARCGARALPPGRRAADGGRRHRPTCRTTRAQLLWRLETPERDPDLCRAAESGARACARRRSVPSSIPAACCVSAEAIAWPMKPGRIARAHRISAAQRRRPAARLSRRPASEGVPAGGGEGRSRPAATLNIGGESTASRSKSASRGFAPAITGTTTWSG